ncbi:MAG TPA: diaminopimelate epimerase [Mycobacteriales bacterium]
MRYLKGHGTENDFVLLPDLDGRLDLSAELVRALCDRRAGLGADGVLRVVRAGDEWFMDYRNADGSVAEMCGNGVRVFARYLADAGLAEPGELTVGTRGGPKRVWVGATGDVTVDMGEPELPDRGPVVGGVPGTAVSMGNPHVVVPVTSQAELTGLDLSRAPEVIPGLPAGQNVEFVLRRAPRALALRVHERGVGETRSCGTGVCAAVVATVAADGQGRGEAWTVDVPGGQLTVEWAEAGPVLLTGPAVLVARGELSEDWVSSVGQDRR